jgi:L-lactate dehydrogenase
VGSERTPDAIAIVGVGAVGATTAYALMNAGAASDIILIGRDTEKVLGEVMDLNHGSSFVPPVRIRAGGYEDCADARVVIITAGVRQKPGESRIDLLGRNLEVVDAKGVKRVLELQLNDQEVESFRNSAEALRANLNRVGL